MLMLEYIKCNFEIQYQQTTDIHNMNESQKTSKLKKPDTKGCRLNDFTYMTF
jgi:hypothetical protein